MTRAFLVATAFILTLTTSPTFAEDEAKRVITLGGDITEIVYQLGEADRLVGRDSTSTYPPEAGQLPDTGYFRQLGAEGVLSLQPDLILATANAGPPEVIEQIASTGVKIVQLPEKYSEDGLIDKVKTIAEALGVPERGKAMADRLRSEIDEAKTAVANMQGHPKVLFIISTGGGAPMAAGRDTSADALIALAGGTNVFASHNGYKAISLESTVASSPEAIAMMEHTLKAMGGVKGVAHHPALGMTPAAKNQRIVARNGSFLLSFGPRLPKAILDFASAIRGREQT